MNQKEISEIKKQFRQDRCAIDRICGCYVDGEKNIKAKFREPFLALPEEEAFKYFSIFRKTLSGTVGKNLITMEFPLETEEEGGTQEFLLRLRNSGLSDDALLDSFYEKVIDSLYTVENYLILLIHQVYDVPGKAEDNTELFDASEDVYDHILCCICPVTLSKPGLSYHPEENSFHNRIQDWIVDMPVIGFLFPAFHDRGSDIHNLLYYTAKPDELRFDFIEPVLGCEVPLSAGDQKETFQSLVEDTLGEQCELEVVKNIHEKLNEMIEENKEEPEPLALDKGEVRNLLSLSGVEEDRLDKLDDAYGQTDGKDIKLMAANIADTRKFEIKTPDIVIRVKPDRTDLIEERIINGRPCLVIGMENRVEVNGIAIRTPQE